MSGIKVERKVLEKVSNQDWLPKFETRFERTEQHFNPLAPFKYDIVSMWDCSEDHGPVVPPIVCC
jgi:G:T-mismatch repair DNA endonuclease (very short patch repair protein)